MAVCPLGPENTATSGLFAAFGAEERLPKLDLELAADLGLSLVSGMGSLGRATEGER